MKASLRDSYDLQYTFRIVIDEAQTEYDALEDAWIDLECVGRVDASDTPLIAVGRNVSIRFAPDYQGTVSHTVQPQTPHDDYTYVHAPLKHSAVRQILNLLKLSKEIGAELYAEVDAPPPTDRDPERFAWTLERLKFGLRNLVGDPV